MSITRQSRAITVPATSIVNLTRSVDPKIYTEAPVSKDISFVTCTGLSGLWNSLCMLRLKRAQQHTLVQSNVISYITLTAYNDIDSPHFYCSGRFSEPYLLLKTVLFFLASLWLLDRCSLSSNLVTTFSTMPKRLAVILKNK